MRKSRRLRPHACISECAYISRGESRELALAAMISLVLLSAAGMVRALYVHKPMSVPGERQKGGWKQQADRGAAPRGECGECAARERAYRYSKIKSTAECRNSLFQCSPGARCNFATIGVRKPAETAFPAVQVQKPRFNWRMILGMGDLICEWDCCCVHKVGASLFARAYWRGGE